MNIIKIGYIRVSSQDQNTARQEVLMKELGVDKIFIDKMSGKCTDRPELKKMLNFARSGDTIICESISRFARNTKDLLTLVDQLTAKGVEFVSQKEDIDISNAYGKFLLTLFAAMAELERAYILERQREGILIAKSQGKYKGRKRKYNENFEKVMETWEKGNITAVKAMKLLNISKSTFYRYARERKSKIEQKISKH